MAGMTRIWRRDRLALRSGAIALTVGLALAGCSSTTSSTGESGPSLKNFLLYGGATVPPPMQEPENEVSCPSVDIIDGAAAMRAGSENPRYQVSINDTARECSNVTADGAYQLKVGVEGLALLGVGGGPVGRISVPVHVIVKRGNTVIASRSRTVAVSIPAGEDRSTFDVVEEGITVPPGDGDVTIAVGFGNTAEAAAPRTRRRR
jgi:hypothetical protein